MKWSKLKYEIEERFCNSLKGRLSIYSTRYGACSCGRAWITLDKKVIANFCTMAFWNTNPVWDEVQSKFITGSKKPVNDTKYDKLLNEYGELSRQDVYESCWLYLHELSVEEALASDNPLIQTLSVVDRRVGKRRLAKIDKEKLHSLAQKLFEKRLEKPEKPMK